MKKQLAKLRRLIHSRLFVSRRRYEREIELLRLSASRCVEDERRQLQVMIDRICYVTSFDYEGTREIRTSLRVSDALAYSLRSPYHRERFFYELAQRISKDLERELVRPFQI